MTEQPTPTPASDLIFEDPPMATRGHFIAGSTPFGLWLAELKKHPGQWAKYPEPRHPTTITSIRKGKAYGVGYAGEYEATGRHLSADRSRIDIFARYVGGDQA